LSKVNFGSFGSTASAFAPADARTEVAPVNEEEDDNYEPPKAEVALEEKDAVYSKEGCKFFLKLKNQEKFDAKGKGTLHVKPLDSKHQLLVRADNALGTIWINIMLAAAIPISHKKNNLIIVSAPNPPISGLAENETVTYLLRFGSEAEATEVKEKLESYKS